MNYEKEVIKNLIDYLIDGKLDSTVVEQFDGVKFPSVYIANKSFQFIRKYDQIDSITDPNIIPVHLVTLTDKYKKGNILYKNSFIDLKTLLISDEYQKKCNFYVVPRVDLLNGNRAGTLKYTVDVDYNSDFDIYGYIAAEISELLKLLYYRKVSGDFHYMTLPDDRKIFFVPESINKIANGAILGRIKHSFNIRGCHFA